MDTREEDEPEMVEKQQAWVVTGPTSGIGRRTALELAEHGTVVLVGRNPQRLASMEQEITRTVGARAVSVVCDLSDVVSAERAAREIAGLGLQIAGVVNNAGAVTVAPERSAQGWDLTFATNHLGPFAFTQALLRHLADGTNVVFVCSAVEDPDRTPAVKAGYRGGRYISAAAGADGRWEPGGSTHAGYDAYATAKQALLASVLAFARETPRLRFNAVEPGFNPTTGLTREAPPTVRFVLRYVLGPMAPFIRYWSTPRRAGVVIARLTTDPSAGTGSYVDENGRPMLGSTRVRDTEFQERVVAETRALLATATDGSPTG